VLCIAALCFNVFVTGVQMLGSFSVLVPVKVEGMLRLNGYCAFSFMWHTLHLHAGCYCMIFLLWPAMQLLCGWVAIVPNAWALRGGTFAGVSAGLLPPSSLTGCKRPVQQHLL
jgi:hypothetical protein